ncbi:MAG: peptidylprolyl isomerase [Bacteroides sp.]|nr:peptidylprolyl isomerase [Bacteroides sp.]
MNRYLSLLICFLFCVEVSAQQQDSLLFSLKVKAARQAGMDTLPLFRQEVDSLRRVLLLQHLTDSVTLAQTLHQVQEHEKPETGREEVVVKQLFRYLPQIATPNTLHRAEQQMDSIYHCLKSGKVDFDYCVQRYSDDKEMRRISPLQMPVEWEQAVDTLQPNTISSPFYTPQGLYIVQLVERYPSSASGQMKKQTLQAARRKAALSVVDSLKLQYQYTSYSAAIRELLRKGTTQKILFLLDGKAYSGADFARFASTYPAGLKKQLECYITKTILDYASTCLQKPHTSFAQRLQAYGEHRLVELITWKEVIRPVLSDESALQTYFAEHRASFDWETPRFKGAVLHCTDKSVAKRARKLLKHLPEEQWKETIANTFQIKQPVLVLFEQGTYASGDNPYVDKKAFKGDKIASPLSHPFTVVLGEKVKGPEEYSEVRERVVEAYKASLQRAWEERLRASHKVEIDQEVLKTVNNH